MTQEQIYKRKKKIAKFCFALLILITSFGFWQAINEGDLSRSGKKQLLTGDAERQSASNVMIFDSYHEK